MTNWWEELELENKTENPAQVKIDQMQAKIEQLKAANVTLLAACEAAYEFANDRPGVWALKIAEQLAEAMVIGTGWIIEQPTGPRLPGLE